MSTILARRQSRRNRVFDRRARQQRFYWGLAIYLLVGAFAFVVTAGPPVRAPEGSNRSQVSGVSGMAEIQNLLGPESSPHPAGSVENTILRAKLIARLKQLGLEVIEQPFVDENVPMVNVLARRPGLPAPRPVLLVTHYDSSRFGAGAGDDLSSVGATLEAIRSLQSETLSYEVWFLFTDGEERGMRGASNFVRAPLPWGNAKPLVFNFDARGASGAVVMYETHAENYYLVSKLLGKLAKPTLSNSIMVEVYKRLPNNTDFTIFKNDSSPGFNFAIIGSTHVYHTPNDNLANLSPRSVQHFSDIIRSITMSLNTWTKADWAAIEPSTPAVYFDIMGGPVIAYPAYWNIILTLVCLGLFIALVLRKATMEPLRSERLVMLVSAMVAAIFSSAVIGWLMAWALRAVEVIDRPFIEGGDLLCMAYAFVAVAVTLPIGAMSFAKANTIQARLAVMAWLTLMAILCSTSVPGAAFLFHFPAIAIGITGLVAPRERWADIIVVAICAVLYVPLLLLFNRALGPMRGETLAGLAALFLSPALLFLSDVAVLIDKSEEPSSVDRYPDEDALATP